MTYKKEDKDYELLNDEVARPLFKNSPVSKELTARVVEEILKVDYTEIIDNIKSITEDMLFSPRTVDSRTDMIRKFYISLDNLKVMDYNSIKDERNVLKKIFYMFVCNEDNLLEAYQCDTFMKKVIKNAKEQGDEKKIPLYLSEDEIRKLDREEAVEEGINLDIEKNWTEMIINMYNDKVSFYKISKYANVSIEKLDEIIENNISKD